MIKSFYLHAVSQAGIDPNDSVLVVCGGPYDKQVMELSGLKNVVISNVGYHDGVKEFAPFNWIYQDAENLTLADNSFDYVVVNAGLHHCASPHRAMCEMLRVAKKGILVSEASDNWFVRLSVALGFTSDFESEPALLSGGTHGGYRNTELPNYIYRWTEREVEKAVRSYLPQWQHSVRYIYGYRIPTERFTMSTSTTKRLVVTLVSRLVWLLERVMPKQGNHFAFVVSKQGELQPWLKDIDGAIHVDLDWVAKNKKYNPKNYRKNPSPF